jgi:hypothetical protein
MGKPWTGITRTTDEFRRWVDTALMRADTSFTPDRTKTEDAQLVEWLEKTDAGGVVVRSRVHAAAVAYRRFLQCELILANAGAPGRDFSLPDWLGVADRTVKYLAEVNRHLDALGLDAKAEPRGWYDQWLDEARREDQRKLAERLNGPPAAGQPVAESRSGIDISASDDQTAAEGEDRGLEGPNDVH